MSFILRKIKGECGCYGSNCGRGGFKSLHSVAAIEVGDVFKNLGLWSFLVISDGLLLK